MAAQVESTEPEVIEAAPSMAGEISDRFAKLMEGVSPNFNYKEGGNPEPETDKEKPSPIGDSKKPAETPANTPILETATTTLTDEPPKNLVGKAAESWNQFKTKANREIQIREQKLAEIQKELETVKKSAPAKVDVAQAPEYAELKKRHDELSERIKMVSIEKHPDFIKYFGDKTKQAVDMAKMVVGEELSPQLEAALKIQDPRVRKEQLENIAEELTGFQQTELSAALVELRKVEFERQSEIDKSSKSYETLEAKNRTEREQSLAQQKASAMAIAKTLGAFTPIEGNEEHNSQIKQNEDFVNAFFDGSLDMSKFAAIPALAAEAIHLKQSRVPFLEAELKKRDEIIAGYQGAKPKVTPTSLTESESPSEGGGFLKKFQENWGNRK